MSLNNYKGNITIVGGFKASTADPLMESHDILVGEKPDGAEVRLDEQLAELISKYEALGEEIIAIFNELDAKLSNVVVGSVGVASTERAGVVQIGENLSITADGILSADAQSYDNATAENDGLMSSQDKLKLDSIEEATVSKAGLMSVADKQKLDGIEQVTQSKAGLMSSEDKKKLDNINQHIGTTGYTAGLAYTKQSGSNFYTITGIGEALGSDVKIPDYIGGLPVKNISEKAFQNLPSVLSIEIPSNVEIDKESFWDSRATVIVPLDYKSPLLEAFLSYKGTVKLKATDKTVYGRSILEGNKQIKEVEFLEGVTELEQYSMSVCTQLTKVNFPESLAKIGTCAFAECANLEWGRFKKPVEMGINAFIGCEKLVMVLDWNESEYPDFLTALSVPDSTSIVFNNNQYSLFLEYTLLDDGTYSVSINDTTANRVYIPSKNPSDGKVVTKVAQNGFAAQKSIEYVFFRNGVTTINYGAFQLCESLYQVELPSTLLIIEGNAFNGCSALAEITIPDSVTEIGASAFANCTSLLRVSLPSNLTVLNDKCFAKCSYLESIEIPWGCTMIYNEAFKDCTNMREITIPGSVTYLGTGILYGCTSLALIIYEGTQAEWNTLLANSSGSWDLGLPNCTIMTNDGNIEKSAS